MSVGFDTNLFIYSFDRTDPDKQKHARDLLARITARQPRTPFQIISETLNAAHRKRHLILDDAREACALLADTVDLVPASIDDAVKASNLAERFKLQFFDAQLIAVSIRTANTFLLSEDMQDGLSVGELTVLDPFNTANVERIYGLLNT